MGFLIRLLSKWQSQGTLIGKTALPVLLVIRLVILGAALSWAWVDHGFNCNSVAVGCSEACSDAATPLSPVRLWILQLVLVLASGLVFLCYLIHLTNQEIQMKAGEGREANRHALRAYLACMASVILVEVIFILAQCFLYGFWVETQFICRQPPCPFPLDCFIANAQERTAFLVIMFSASCVSLLLSVAEVVCVLLKAKPWNRQPDDAKALRSESKVEEESHFLVQLLARWHSHAGLLGKTVLPVLQLTRLIIVREALGPLWRYGLFAVVCQSLQPGCSNSANNERFPFSLLHYWTLQVALVLAPGLIFFCYLVHLINKEKQARPGTGVKGHSLGAYLACLSAVILLEVGFAVGQALKFGFYWSIMFTCNAVPCLQTVACYIPRATEKTLFIFIMFLLACVSALLTLVEMCVVLKKERPWERRQNEATSKASEFQMGSTVRDE